MEEGPLLKQQNSYNLCQGRVVYGEGVKEEYPCDSVQSVETLIT